jgi:hypothetical protein
LRIYNANPLGAHETDRVRGFYENGQTFALEAFRGNVKERIEELQEAAYGAKIRTGLSDDERKKFGIYYSNRINLVKAEAETLLKDRKEAKDFLGSLGQSIKFLQGDNPQ